MKKILVIMMVLLWITSAWGIDTYTNGTGNASDTVIFPAWVIDSNDKYLLDQGSIAKITLYQVFRGAAFDSTVITNPADNDIYTDAPFFEIRKRASNSAGSTGVYTWYVRGITDDDYDTPIMGKYIVIDDSTLWMADAFTLFKALLDTLQSQDGWVSTFDETSEFVMVDSVYEDKITAQSIKASAITSSEAPNLDATVSSRGISDHSAADVWTAGSRALSTPNDYKATGFSTFDNTADLVIVGEIADTTMDTLVDRTWDEVLTGATHNIATSAGRRMREISGYSLSNNTAQSGGATWIKLAAAESVANDFYNSTMLVIVDGTGEGQARVIDDYTGATDSVTLDAADAWIVNPDNTSEYIIYADVKGHVAHIHDSAIDDIFEYETSNITNATGIGKLLIDSLQSQDDWAIHSENAAILDTLQSQDDWVSSHEAADIWRGIDTLNTIDTSDIGDWFVNNISGGSGGLSLADTVKLSDYNWITNDSVQLGKLLALAGDSTNYFFPDTDTLDNVNVITVTDGALVDDDFHQTYWDTLNVYAGGSSNWTNTQRDSVINMVDSLVSLLRSGGFNGAITFKGMFGDSIRIDNPNGDAVVYKATGLGWDGTGSSGLRLRGSGFAAGLFAEGDSSGNTAGANFQGWGVGEGINIAAGTSSTAQALFIHNTGSNDTVVNISNVGNNTGIFRGNISGYVTPTDTSSGGKTLAVKEDSSIYQGSSGSDTTSILAMLIGNLFARVDEDTTIDINADGTITATATIPDSLFDTLTVIHQAVNAVSGGSGANKCSLYVCSDISVPTFVDDILVRMQASGGASDYYQYTDTDGLAIFSLDNGTWYGNIEGDVMYSLDTTLHQTFVISSDMNDTIMVTEVSISAATDTGYCNLYLDVHDYLEGEDIDINATLTATPNGTYKTLTGDTYIEDSYSATADSTGRIELKLLRSSMAVPQNNDRDSLRYNIVLETRDGHKAINEERYEIPDSTTHKFSW